MYNYKCNCDLQEIMAIYAIKNIHIYLCTLMYRLFNFFTRKYTEKYCGAESRLRQKQMQLFFKSDKIGHWVLTQKCRINKYRNFQFNS